MNSIIGLLLVVVGLGYLAFTLVLSRKKKPFGRGENEPSTFVFVVPALNEERVIAATVNSLLETCADRGQVVVINDGSSDETGNILGELESERVWVIERTAPNARVGKGAALNDAYRQIRDRLLAQGLSPDDVVFCIVDADGRLEADCLAHVAPYFNEPRVGAVQLLVRIRNRATWLGRFQDYEFMLFSSLTQTAREKLGSVGLGGNGQFTRLSALMTLGDEPWSDCLTEDLDLGVRLAINGWENRFCGETVVDQQGLTSIRPLLKQRARWAQGHFQCWSLIPRIVRSDMPTTTVLDMCYYLLAPAIVLLHPIFFSIGWISLGMSVSSDLDVWLTQRGLVIMCLMYAFSIWPTVGLSLLYRRRSGDISLVSALVMGHLLLAYNFIWYVAEARAIFNIIRRKNSWAKTDRSTEPSNPTPVMRAA